MQKNKIIYSLQVMQKLVEMGFVPKETFPNPKYPQYNCWVFEINKEFEDALNFVLGGSANG